MLTEENNTLLKHLDSLKQYKDEFNNMANSNEMEIQRL